MEIVSNDKNFKVLKFTSDEARHVGMGTSDGVICMHCNEIHNPTYYIAVLNDCMCEKCYNEWLKTAENYPEDRDVEIRNYLYYRDEFLLYDFQNNI